MKLAPCLLLLVGCAEVADSFDGPFQGNGPATATFTGGSQIFAGTYKLAFATEPGSFQMPNSLIGLASETELFARDTDCSLEGKAGVALYPYGKIEAGRPAMSSELVPIWPDGPVPRIQSKYQLALDCDDSVRVVDGTSTFTFFVDRFYRTDAVTAPFDLDQMSVCTPICGAGGQTLKFTSYYNFAIRDPNDNPASADTCGVSTTNTESINVHWFTAGSYRNNDHNSGQAVVFDWLGAGNTTELGDNHNVVAQSSVTIAPPETFATSCDHRLASEHAIDLGDSDQAASLTFDDGVYVDEGRVWTEPVTLRPAQDITNGFAVVLDMDGADHLRVTKNGSETSYRLQVLPDGRYLFYFDVLAAADEIVIAPR